MYKLIVLLNDGKTFEVKFTYSADIELIKSRVQEAIYTSNNIINKNKLVSAVKVITEVEEFYFKVKYNKDYDFKISQIKKEEFKNMKSSPIFVSKFNEEKNAYIMEETFDHTPY
jgi:hypothetical protein